MHIKTVVLALVLAAGLQAQHLTFTNNSPFAGDSVAIYAVWYGPWTDTASQAIVADFLDKGLTLLPSISISRLYPVNTGKTTILKSVFHLGGQVSVAYNSAYSNGVTNQLYHGVSGDTALIGDLITGGQIPTPGTSGPGGGANTYTIIFIGPGITSSVASACAYTGLSGLNYINSVVFDQTNISTTCPYLPYLNQVSGTALSDTIIEGAALEAVHAIQAISWKLGSASIMEVCITSYGPSYTAPNPPCNASSSVCQYTTSVVPLDGVPRYYYLPETYVNMPPGSDSGACQQTYTPPAPALGLIGKLRW